MMIRSVISIMALGVLFLTLGSETLSLKAQTTDLPPPMIRVIRLRAYAYLFKTIRGKSLPLLSGGR